MLDRITVHGARQHNLKNIDVEIPRNSLTVITGLSGSGKSSLAFDTIYAEGQRRYMESLSSYAKRFVAQVAKPDVDFVFGLSPVISIEKTTSRSRSTVSTITGILVTWLLYSSIGVRTFPVAVAIWPDHGADPAAACSAEIRRAPDGVGAGRPRPARANTRGSGETCWRGLSARIDGVLRSWIESCRKRKNHTIEVVVDRLLVKPGIEKRLEASIETATKLANGLVLIVVVNGEERLYSQKLACTECGASIPQLEPRSFSFNSPYGACEECHGLGSKWTFDPAKVIVDSGKPLFDGGLGPGAGSWQMQQQIEELAKKNRINLAKPFEELTRKARETLVEGAGGSPGILGILDETYQASSEAYREWLTDYMSPAECPACHGKRLRPASLSVRVKNFAISEFTGLPISRALMTVRNW
jgi:excinuclease ABC subunit A